MSTSILLLTGLVSGPVSAFLLSYPHVLVLLLFPVTGLFRLGGRWFTRMLVFCLAPAVLVVYGLVSRNAEITARAARWCLALPVGMYFAGELDTGAILSKLSLDRSRPLDRMARNLLLVLSLAGPVAERAGDTFREGRRNGLSLWACIEKSLFSLGDSELRSRESARSGSRFPLFLAGSTWLLMLWSISGAEAWV